MDWIALFEEGETAPMWIGTAQELLEANEGDEETAGAIAELAAGVESVQIGGGAQSIVTLRRWGLDALATTNPMTACIIEAMIGEAQKGTEAGQQIRAALAAGDAVALVGAHGALQASLAAHICQRASIAP